MDFLKMDSNMFLSIVNMKLRDEFESIEDFCNYYDISLDDILNRLDELKLKYHRDINQVKSL